MQATHTCDMQLTGTLVEDAQHRQVPVDSEAHFVPALCFTVELESASHNRCHVQQLFPAGHELQCKAAAHRLKRGTRVEFQAALVGIELHARNASHVHALADPATDTTPQPQPEETTA